MTDIFRTVRELLENRDCVLLGNAVDTEGKLYNDSVENLTAILAMRDSYGEMLAALEKVQDWLEGGSNIHTVQRYVTNALNKAKGN